MIRVAMVGQRGLPATFGGIEHHVEELSRRIVALGHEVTVYCRSNYSPPELTTFQGTRLRHPPTIGTKHLDAISHSGASTLSAIVSKFDIIHYHGLGPGLLAPLPRFLSASKVVQTVHGFDHQRAKWGRGARAVLSAAAWMSERIPDTTIVVSRALFAHYESLGRATSYIPNGVAERVIRPADEITQRWGLEPNGYLLFVGRLVPEKCPDQLIRCFRKIPGNLKLVIVGGSSFTDRYARQLAEMASQDDRVVLAGWAYGSLLDELYSNAAAFVLPSSLEGLPLTLLEAAAYGTPCIASDIPCNAEVLGSDGPGHRLFAAGNDAELVDAIQTVISNPQIEREGTKELRNDVLMRYNWDESAAATLRVYEKILP